ncbi:endoribonuclease ybey [Plakobranchus ocellatus]|uniref:Endoribonuclease ybey n=1 Tax=Plakobranchus ocellatus TaxID=259542 RepID=A0AAV4DQM8_9GAST|nr:endoribonuclease ybey [Plakobranchus ocellatus]
MTNRGIKRLNKRYRGIDEVTDVLAFPFHEISPENAGELPEVLHGEECILGDIVLGMPYIASDCLRRDEDLQSTLVTMFTHGLCHLVGFDHETDQEWKQMYRRELDILERFNQLSGYQCKPLLGVGHYKHE